MAQTITFTGTAFGSTHDNSTTYRVDPPQGTANPSSGISKTELTNGINITFSSDSITSATCTVENGTCVGEEATVTWSVTPTPIVPTPDVPPPVVPTPDVPTPDVPNVPTPTSIDWQPLTGTIITETDSEACSASQNTTYYTIGTPQAGSQLYFTQDQADQVTANGRMVTGQTLYTIVNNGNLGTAGSCPTYYNHVIYVSAPATTSPGLCDQDYTIISSKVIKTTVPFFDLSNGLNEQVYESNGTDTWTPPGGGTLFYGVSKLNTQSTQDGTDFTVYEINSTGVVQGTGTRICTAPTPGSPSPTPTDNSPSPAVGPGGPTPVLAPVDKGQEQ